MSALRCAQSVARLAHSSPIFASSRLSAALELCRAPAAGARPMTTGTREAPVRSRRRVSLILRASLDDLGHAGQEVSVSPGFARNKLVPAGLAVYATEANRRLLRVELPPAELAAEDARRAQNRVRARVGGVVLKFRRATSDGRALYGAITASDVVEALQQTVLRNLRLQEANVRIPAAAPAGADAPAAAGAELGAGAGAGAGAGPGAGAGVAAAAAAEAPAAPAGSAANVLTHVGRYTIFVEPARVGYAGLWCPLAVDVASS